LEAFESSARSLTIDWHVTDRPLDATEIKRWSERLGQRLVEQRRQEMEAVERGLKPEGPLNPALLMVLGLDGGRVQMRDPDAQTKSKWKEDKVATFTSYIPGDGKEKKPRKVMTTYTATMQDAQAFGPMVALEAYRRGLWQVPMVLLISDGGNWIDPLAALQGLADVRIIDFYHADERLFEVAGALCGKETPAAAALGTQLESLLYEGKVAEVIAYLKTEVQRLGPAQANDGPTHPREVLRQNLGYFEKHQAHMHYDEYRRQGWPIGSGNVEAGVKCFNKRIKGTDQFWTQPGVEAIMALRALWLSQDSRWNRYWANRSAYGPAQAA
jgi:hypothetical protein